MDPLNRPESILEGEAWRLLEEGGSLVTVNQRLARHLTGRFSDVALCAGKTVWKTPDILPFSAWLQRGYDRSFYSGRIEDAARKRPILLLPDQELRLWERIICESSYGKSLLQVFETAKTARQAWEICIAWRLSFEEMALAPPEDTRAFLGWAEDFKRECRRHGWLDNARLGDFIMEQFAAGVLKPPEHLILAGFDEFTPQQDELINALASAGCRVYAFAPSQKRADAVRCAFADADAEMTAAAKWARRRMEADSAKRIGVIVPSLESARERLIRAFDEVFHPGQMLSPVASKQRLYNISLGDALSAYPVIDAGLLFLRLALRPFSVEEYSRFLRSPFLAGAEAELSKRAILDTKIREHGEIEVAVKRLIYFCSRHEGRRHPGVFCPILEEALTRFSDLAARLTRRQVPSGWAADFSNLLEALGWPGERPLSSEEHQTVSAWQDALYRFSEMDLILGETDIAAAMSDLKRICDETTFQPETREVPVQVMGMLEAGGARFDHLWILGMDAETWPPSPRPNPLIPAGLQRRRNIPHASPEREFAYSRQVTDRLLASADEVIISYPLMEGESRLYPSPLIAALPVRTVETEPPLPYFGYWREIQKSVNIEQITDQKGPEVLENTHIRGGTGLLKAQAACPFSAFAAYRLRAKGIEMPVPGLNPMERGSLVHRALELLWEKLESSRALTEKSREELNTAIADAVLQAVKEMAARHPQKFTRRFTALEKQRLQSLLLEWLEVEAQRAPFEVRGREKYLGCTVGGIGLNTYADRIDRTEAGLVMIDYKTGDPSPRDWFTKRLSEPQLPLYSLSAQEPVAGVLFARIQKGNARYLGIAEDEALAPGVTRIGAAGGIAEKFTSMAEIIDFWRTQIESLAAEIRAGHAAVSPVSIRTSCRYCELGPLCRIREAGAEMETEEDADDPTDR